jgi:hypothetical protein
MIYSFHRRTIFASLAAITALSGYSEAPAASAATSASAFIAEAPVKKGRLLNFISYNTVESKMMHDQLAGDAGVKALIEKYFTLTTYIEGRDAEQILRYQVAKFPTTIATNEDGTEIDRIVGFARSQETMALLEAAAKGESGLTALSAKAAAADATLEDRLTFAEAAIRRGKYADALRELTICLDRSSAPAAKEDRRYLKLALARLVTLGNAEPAALELVKTRRDALEKTLSPHFPEPIMIVFAFNEALKQADRNVDLYLRLPAGSPLRERLFPAVLPQLVAQRRYQEAADGADLETLVNSAYPKKVAKAATPVEALASVKPRMRHIDHGRQRVIDLTSTAAEALLGIGQLEKAKRIAGRAVETFDDKLLKTRLQQAAQRAASPASGDFSAWLEAQSQASSSDR